MSNKKVIIIRLVFLLSFFSLGLKAHYIGARITMYDAISSAKVAGGIIINKIIKGFVFLLVIMSVAFIVMAASPAVVIVQPSSDGETISGNFQFVAHITNPGENLNRVEFSITNTTGTVKSDFTNPNRNTPGSGEDFKYTLNTAELADGSYTLTVNAINENITSSNTTTVTRNFVINNIPPPLSITSSSPVDDPTTQVGTSQKFEINLNRSASTTWYIDGFVAQTNQNAASASYTNSTAGVGIHTITANATDGYYFISRTWNWAVVPIPIYNVSGYVFDNSGSGLEGVQVQSGSNQGITSASGYYLITGLLNGTYNFSYSKTGFDVGYLEVTINGIDYINANKTIYDTTSPTSVSNPITITGNFFVNNSWVNPTDTDFSYVLFKYSNGTELRKVDSPANYLNLQWQPHYTQNISAQTVDTYGSVNDTLVWFNATIPNNLPVQAPIGNKTIYKGQLLTFSISATDADSDPMRYGTNASKGSFDNNTGTYTWTPGDGDSGVYVWEFNSSDSYGGIASEIITVEVKNPLDLDLRLLEPIVVSDENGTSVGIWQDAHVGHIGKLIGYNSTFKNAAGVRLVLNVTEIGNNATNDTYKVTLEKNGSKSCPDGTSICRVKFEIGPEGVREGVFNFSLKIDVNGYIDQTPVFNYTNLTTVYLPIVPVFKIKQTDAAIAIVSEGKTTTITYVLEANGTVNMTNISIFDSLYPQKYFNISRYEVSGNTSRCYNENQNQTPCSVSYKYPATIGALSRFKSEESEMGFPYIINMATFNAKNESGYPINDTDYVEVCVNKCWKGSIPVVETYASRSSGGGGGGGIAPSEDINNIERREVREMDILSRTASTYVFRSADPVMVVAFESSVSENAVPVAVEILKNRSKNIKEDAPGKVYKYFNVFVGTSGFSRKVSNGVVAYRVNNSWLAENNIDPADISLYKWRGTWVKLDTEIAENRSNYTYYASLTGNFSSFAIAAAKEQKIGGEMSVPDMPASPDQQNTTQAIANLSAGEPKHKIPGLSAAVILVFGMAGIIFNLKRNYKKSNKKDVRK